MTTYQAKKRIEAIVNWSVHYGNIALTPEDIEALNKAIAILGITQGFVSLYESGEDEQ